MSSDDLTADRVAVANLMSEYAACLDARDPHRFAALFLPDGKLIARLHDGQDSLLQGTHALSHDLSIFHDPSPFLQTLHVVGNAAVDFDGDAAAGWMHCVGHHLFRREEGVYDDVMYLLYDDDYARTPDGWRFASRRITLCWSELVPATGRPGLGARPARP